MQITLLLIILLLAAATLYQAWLARLQADRLAKFMSHIEWRVILLERDVVRRLIERGVAREDVDSIHQVLDRFEDAERQMKELFRK